MNTRRSLAAIALTLTGCTHWSTTPNYGPRTEVGRQLVGAPQVEEVSSATASAGFSA